MTNSTVPRRRRRHAVTHIPQSQSQALSGRLLLWMEKKETPKSATWKSPQRLERVPIYSLHMMQADHFNVPQERGGHTVSST